MPLKLKEVVISTPGDAVHRTRSEVPDYLQRAIADSVERGKAARLAGADASRSERPSKSEKK